MEWASCLDFTDDIVIFALTASHTLRPAAKWDEVYNFKAHLNNLRKMLIVLNMTKVSFLILNFFRFMFETFQMSLRLLKLSTKLRANVIPILLTK